ncbi:MAG: sulfatase-like hydrolase/transferase [Fimbriiglobus sp.]|nr:sulfatase-like hydrolase/transferase [Fimbriiglobus sp.]
MMTSVSPPVGRALAAVFALVACVTSGSAADRKPNFVFVYSDDHRWDAMGVVQKEQDKAARFPWFKSPNMDRLAAGGVRFRNAFVTLSLCAPSRAAFLTGRYNHANGITNNGTPFPADAVTHASLLREAGYKTAYVGKWHMGNQKGPRPGFDYSASFVGQGKYNECPFEIDGKPTPTKGWVDAVSTDYAIGFIKENRDKPFAVVVGLKSAHGPRGGTNLPEHLRKLYANETSRPTPNCGVPAVFHQKDAKTGKYPPGLADNAVHLDYLRHVAGVDEQVGRLLDTLDDLKLTDDTVVVYTSDNGYYLGEHNSGDKRSLYEESLRIPFLVRYPRMFAKGKAVDEMVLNIDLAPTFLDLAGVPIPKEMQGASWKNLVAGRKPAKWRDSFFAEYYKELGDVPTCHAVRTTTHKLVKYPGHPEWTELFDLKADPYETKNLATDAKLLERLDGELTAQMKAVGYAPPKGADPPKGTAAMPVIDTHVHLWDIERRDGLGWIAADNKVLNKSFLPKDMRLLAAANGVKGVVVVQAGQSLDDNQWNLDVTSKNKALYRGVVGNLSKVIGTDEFVPLFEKLYKDERYVGYRLSGRTQKELGQEFFRHLELTAKAGRTVDLLLNPKEYSLDDAAEIARRVPKLKIILDHFGNVELTAKPLDPEWVKKFKAVAKHPNVYCKVSALYGLVKKQPAPKSLDFYKPVLDLAVEAFGEDRLVFGSDWPVSEMTDDYASVLKLVKGYFAEKGEAVSNKVFHQNAVKFYGIPEPKDKE